MNNYIISLTTIPSRFEQMYKTIDSIISQTFLPSKIIVNIPKLYNFRYDNCEISMDRINDFINNYSKFNVIVNLLEEDYGPGTKLLGLLNSNIMGTIDIKNTNTYIILVDDDDIYKPYMIEYFDKEIKSHNTEIASFNVYGYNNIKIGQCTDGFLIKLNILDKFLDYYRIIKDQDYIKYQDDLYISYYFYLLNKTIEYIKLPNNCLIYEPHSNSSIDALFKIQGKYSRQNVNDTSYVILNKLNENGYFKNII